MSQLKLEKHFQEQDDKARIYLDEAITALNKTYDSGLFESLKKAIKAIITQALSIGSSDEKIAITLVDIQNDFTINQFALYAPDGENTILSNMALLDSILELHEDDPAIINRLEIITSQDAHRLDRTTKDKEANIFLKTYSQEKALALVEQEQIELRPFNPAENSYGLHCLIGSRGAGIAKPIEERLHKLTLRSFNIHRFGKINFSAPEAGMRLKEDIDISDHYYRDPEHSIYPDDAQSFLDFFKTNPFKSIYVTGICGDVCVQQAAEGLKENIPLTTVLVIDPCVHYLVVPDIKTYDLTRSTVMHSYQERGINNLNVLGYRSNPTCPSTLYPTDGKQRDIEKKNS